MDPENENPDAPTTGGDGVVINVENPPDESNAPPDQTAALEAITGRIEAVETRITEGLEGEREWTLETITSLRQELTNLLADLSEIATGFPSQVQALRDELTQLSQSLQTAPVITVEAEPEIPVVEPGALPASVDGTPPPAGAKNALPKGKRKVV